MFRSISIVTLTLLIVGVANAVPVPVDLTGWTADLGPGSQGAANWVVQPGNDSVIQGNNSATSVFYDSTNLASQGMALAGQISVGADGDDDFVGFVLGYNPNEINTPEAPNDGFWLIDWKQGDQSGASQGLALSHVLGPIVDEFDYWEHENGVSEVARAASLGSTGWVDNELYNFEIVFTSQLIQVVVDNILELSVSAAQAGVASFADGAFGFYNYSQSLVTYAGITEEDFCVVNPQDPTCISNPNPNPIPAPGTLALLGIALMVMRMTRRKITY